MYLMEGLQQIPARERTFAGTLGDPKLDTFLNKVRAHPQDHKELLLNARLHPFPLFSKTIMNYPVEQPNGTKEAFLEWVVINSIDDKLAWKELSQIAEAKLKQEIEAELKLWDKTVEALKKVDQSKLKRSLVQAALLDPKMVDDPNGDPAYIYFEYPRIGSDFAKSFLGSVGQEILKSKASEGLLIKLGHGLARHAINLLGKDSLFKRKVMEERKKQARKAKQAEEERKREERRRRRR
jgi:hypothetical protein